MRAHSNDVADGVVFSLDSERRRIDYLGVSLVRNPKAIQPTKKTTVSLRD